LCSIFNDCCGREIILVTITARVEIVGVHTSDKVIPTIHIDKKRVFASLNLNGDWLIILTHNTI
jgi:hypothetical protein